VPVSVRYAVDGVGLPDRAVGIVELGAQSSR
jgi:hypothetical protein